MWRQILDYGRAILELTRKTQQHEADIKLLQQADNELRQELRLLAEMVREIRQEQQHDRELAAKDHENLLLRLENYVLRAERRLPPRSSGDSEAEETQP